MTDIVISGTGLFTPRDAISNEELVASFNAYVELHNAEHAEEIAAGELAPLQPSSAEFIEKASGIKSRFVMNKEGILDPERMVPSLPDRPNEAQSIQCEMAVAAAGEALQQAGKTSADIDAVIVAASNMQRAYPAMAVEIQDALDISGFGFDMNVACSSATFGIQQARDMILSGSAGCVLMVNPEICSGHLNFRDRDSHFIFGDVCTAVVIERADTATAEDLYGILDSKLQTIYSNNIRNNFGFLNRCDESGIGKPDKLFVQEGRKVFKEVCPAVAKQIAEQLEAIGIAPTQLKRMWLHQANLSMNQLISRRVLGRDATAEEAPNILDEYANTSSAGSVIAFHKHRADFSSGDLGVLCSFGAGYSIGSVVLRKL
ncbi:beta-ketoacyl-ACP synthase III [Pseudohalioglobus sediminis]|uniref:Beta-ketoacyl-ACP synthase III n=1 Tax=Pseudohalioglobus sediminis TaxID=2606449 RepID=A0A5B0WM56_9GAMM|nr:beta-ketoacyl-ACP synthase III [Pseudohalioglobus sediminis]KAA1188134.1 beta-ketoacyl-ACP synthase III [Pseudohalioglobus sediminis]